jgi:hypothetical protein
MDRETESKKSQTLRMTKGRLFCSVILSGAKNPLPQRSFDMQRFRNERMNLRVRREHAQ